MSKLYEVIYVLLVEAEDEKEAVLLAPDNDLDYDQPYDVRLSSTEIAQQDLVDNAVHDLLCVLYPQCAWDIELIGAVRDVAIEQITHKYNVPETILYP